MRMLSAVAAMVWLTAAASAQTPNVNLIPELQSKSPEEKEQEAIRERAYKDSLRKIPDAKGASDPWGNVRGADAPKAVAPKAVAPKAVAPKADASARPKPKTQDKTGSASQ